VADQVDRDIFPGTSSDVDYPPKVCHVGLKVIDIALLAIGKLSVGTALPAMIIENSDDSPLVQVPGTFKVFFEVLGPAIDHHRQRISGVDFGKGYPECTAAR
jgi:hypothetical protein